ncbi:uncharacterized protein LOC127363699 [Dicentrarchus labrax]|uniref:uncharacterized protein LOC127363699 n=1 Tax=Dicentrarchus labrax TaxID=13489 RepID=UPI0021F69869|nr:uncharacterized protein LOC127363699 [Dicentrarchus labrax]XP_051256466.1 uncharacterized protein LOC127363699 [Dicentrarchus labrax]
MDGSDPAPEKCAESRFLEEETDPADTMKPSQGSAGPPASGCESTQPETGSERKQLRIFVTLLTVRVLYKCHSLHSRSQEDWPPHLKRLVDQTMEGLAPTEGFCPDLKSIDRVCEAVLKELQEKLCGRRTLETVILLEDPAVDAVIVQMLQAHIRLCSAELAKTASCKSWREVLLIAGLVAGVCLLVAFGLIGVVYTIIGFWVI